MAFTTRTGVSGIRHDPPWSVNVRRFTPTPLSRTSSAPEESNARVLGLVKPLATSWAAHPLLTVGGV